MLMLVATMFTALLPLTAASCPCPAQDPAAEVCGSDQRTYRSECDLRCDNQGVLLAHPGPCSAGETAAPGRLYDAAQLHGGRDLHRRRRSATEEERKWQEHADECQEATCSECGEDDEDCNAMCQKNCWCACGGYPPGGMDYLLWVECNSERRCWDKNVECMRNCGVQECYDSCVLDWNKCQCECVQRAGNQSSAASTTTCTTSAPSTTSAPITSTTSTTTSAPSTAAAATPGEPPRSALVCEGWGCAFVLVLACALVCVGAGLCAWTRARAPVACCFIGYAPGTAAQPAPHPQTRTNGDVEPLPVSKPPVERYASDMPLHSRNVFDLKTDTFVLQKTLDS